MIKWKKLLTSELEGSASESISFVPESVASKIALEPLVQTLRKSYGFFSLKSFYAIDSQSVHQSLYEALQFDLQLVFIPLRVKD